MALRKRAGGYFVQCDYCPVEYYDTDPSKRKPVNRVDGAHAKPEEARQAASDAGFVRIGMKHDSCPPCKAGR